VLTSFSQVYLSSANIVGKRVIEGTIVQTLAIGKRILWVHIANIAAVFVRNPVIEEQIAQKEEKPRVINVVGTSVEYVIRLVTLAEHVHRMHMTMYTTSPKLLNYE
jgi:hypothetical protein